MAGAHQRQAGVSARRGAVNRRHRPLRKNLGKKNCELGEEDIGRICDTFLAFEETEQSKIFDNDAFGYWKSDGRDAVTPEADAPAAKYIERGALTQRMLPDALHIANAAIAQVDVW